jgi:chorismate synthase
MQKQKMAKLDQPYKIEELSRDNTDPKAYIEKNLGEKQLYPSQEPSHGDGGSNIKFDYKKEAHMGTQPKSARELYNQVYMNRKAISGINFAQRDAVKANEVLNLYSRQSPNRPVEQQTNPMEVEEQKQEAKDEQKVEQKQQGKQSGGGSIVKQEVGSVVMDPQIKAGMRELELQ